MMNSHSTTRLERLLLLLSTGTTVFIRQAAAKQISELIGNYQTEVFQILNKLLPLLLNKQWETRIYTALTIECILSNLEPWIPGVIPSYITSSSYSSSEDEDILLLFSTLDDMKVFNLNDVLNSNLELLSSSGQQFDVDEKERKKSDKNFQQQLSHIKSTIGNIPGIGEATLEYIEEKDLEHVHELKRKKTSHSSQLEKKSVDLDNLYDRLKELLTPPNNPHVWPFIKVSNWLISALFAEDWTLRHGAIIGLIALFKSLVHYPRTNNSKNFRESQHSFVPTFKEYIFSLGKKCLELFCLEKFDDYHGDRTSSPNREAIAQLLGLLCEYHEANKEDPGWTMDEDKFEDVIILNLLCLANLESGKSWQARHGGFLGLLAIAKNRFPLILSKTHSARFYDILLCGISDVDEDIKSISCEIAIVLLKEKSFMGLKDDHKLTRIVSTIWDGLEDLDECGQSIKGLLSLLIQVYTEFPEMIQQDKNWLLLAKKLWPIFRHPSTQVRKTTLQTVSYLLLQNSNGMVIRENTRELNCLMRLVFQNILIEDDESLIDFSKRVWYDLIHLLYKEEEVCLTLFEQSFPLLLSLGLNYPLLAYDMKYWFSPPMMINIENETSRFTDGEAFDLGLKPTDMNLLISEAEDGQPRLKNKHESAVSLSLWISFLSNHSFEWYSKFIRYYLIQSSLGYHKQYCAWIILALLDKPSIIKKNLKLAKLIYDDALVCLETGANETIIYNECQNLCILIMRYYTQFQPAMASASVHHSFIMTNVGSFLSSYKSLTEETDTKVKVMTDLFQQYKHIYDRVHIRTLSAIAALIIKLVFILKDEGEFPLPEKLNPLIRPLMSSIKLEMTKRYSLLILLSDSIKPEDNCSLSFIKELNANGLAKLIYILSSKSKSLSETTSPHVKIISNLLNILKELPENGSNPEALISKAADERSTWIWSIGWPSALEDKIIILEDPIGKDSPSIPDKGGKGLVASQLSKKKTSSEENIVVFDDPEYYLVTSEPLLRIFPVLKALVTTFSVSEFDLMDSFHLFQKIEALKDDLSSEETLSSLKLLWLLGFIALESSSRSLKLKEKLLTLILPLVEKYILDKNSFVRFWTSQVLVVFVALQPSLFFTLIEEWISGLNHPMNITLRQGTLELIYTILKVFSEQTILPFLIFLILPIMKATSDSVESIRLLASKSFSICIKLLPLELGTPSPSNWPSSLIERRQMERVFLEQLLKPSKIDPYNLPIALPIDLRSYQQEGINWLAFLKKYGLHGILCDDMGLGKTLQTLAIIASHSFECVQKKDYRKPISLIVCPTSLLGHWKDEVNKYLHGILIPCLYTGSDKNRKVSFEKAYKSKDINLIIVSYELLRNDIATLSSISYDYIVLDEGHAIKNPKSKLTLAIKSLLGMHRLILSGTPIQNNIVELWSLFDWLLPGYLGSLKAFMKNYAKPILACKETLSLPVSNNTDNLSKPSSASAPKTSTSQTNIARQKAILALESLHKQTLPFLLRRMKEDVLKDLPPKIIQDYYCDLSPLQKELYEAYANFASQKLIKEKLDLEELSQSAQTEVTHDKDQNGSLPHAFTILQNLRKICNHPSFILNTRVFPNLEKALLKSGYKQGLSDSRLKKDLVENIALSGKLNSLKQLFIDLGIGTNRESSTDTGSGFDNEMALENVETIFFENGSNKISRHRVLLFCQVKGMIDLVEQVVFKEHFPDVTCLRLDGNTPSHQRSAIVSKFNEDPSIDVLLLTTGVGGQGLTLTGADVVIFLEVDWNPSKDLQAMDRAHRLGQKNTVLVYRFITRATVEEKCLGLQNFKLQVSGQIITQQNRQGLENLDLGQVIKLTESDEYIS